MKIPFSYIACLLLVACNVSAQKIAVKSNLIYDATATINLGAEYRMASKWTMDISGNYNGWTFSDNKKWKNWSVQPEARYWFCEAFNGHFVGVHLLGGEYNIGNIDLDFKIFNTDFRKLKNNRYDGWLIGGGIVYGYSWLLSKHWNLESVLGIGYVYTRYDTYGCHECGNKQDEGNAHRILPTKIGINIIYVF